MSPKLATLAKRLERLESRKQPVMRRVLRMIVEKHWNADAEIAAFRAANGVAGDDLDTKIEVAQITLIARVIVPHERREG